MVASSLGVVMNVKRGLWRAWMFVTVLWIIGSATLACLVLPGSVANRKYQYVYTMRSDVPDPNKVDWNKSLYEIMRSPSKDKLAVTFDLIPYQYIASRDEDVSKGTEVRVDFQTARNSI